MTGRVLLVILLGAAIASAQTGVDLALTATLTGSVPNVPNGLEINLNCKSTGAGSVVAQLKVFRSLNGAAEVQVSPDSLKMTCTGTGQNFPFGDNLSGSTTQAKYRFAVGPAAGETVLGNNEATVNLLPDLAASFSSTTVTVQKINATTYRLTVSTRIKNLGTVTAAACANEILFDHNRATTWNSGLILPGQAEDKVVSFDIASTNLPGQHAIGLKVDFNNTLTELNNNKTNNGATVPFVGGYPTGSDD